MSRLFYDVVTVGDFRFPGGTSAAIAEELKAQAAAGYRTGLIQVKGPVLKYPHPVHPQIRASIDQGLADLLDPDRPVSARLLLVHHPQAFTHLPTRRLAVEADRRLLIVHHPPFDAIGEPYYDWARIDLHAREALGGELLWAPVGPAVRAQFGALDMASAEAQATSRCAPPLLENDWYNILDPGPWRTLRDGSCDVRPVIGRHSRPDPLKWPETREVVLRAYPDDPRFTVRVLGAGPYLAKLLGGYPSNWQVWGFNQRTPARFLKTIDFFVYFHHSRWVEAFGRTIIEALASGAVAVLQPSFRKLFGNAALYAEPGGVAALVGSYHADPRAYREQSKTGAAAVEDRFSPRAHLARLSALIGPPEPRINSLGARPASPSRRALFFSSNGVGMGHLARLLAIARRCPASIQPVFVTLSQAMKVVQEHGFLTEYLPFHAYLGADVRRWNHFLRAELREILGFYDPAVVMFDGNMPYGGLLGALDDYPECLSVWCRRGMWQPGASREAIEREGRFDAVLEPGDLAGAFDAGPTAQSRSRTRSVAPIRLLDDDEMLACDEARSELGLDPERPAVLLQLGSGNNYDFDTARRLALAHLAKRGGVQVAAAEWLMADRTPDLPQGVLRLRRFPLGRWLKAFDFTVSAVGYNSFHELLFAGIPTVFVPNENPQQDDQLTRARYAERHGLGLCVRAHEVYRLGPALDRLLDPEERAAIRARCAALERENGAVEAARMIEELAFMRRADRRRG